MPTFELTLKLCPYGLEVVVEAEVYVRGAETVTILLYFVALAVAEFTEAGHEVPVAVEVNGETGTLRLQTSRTCCRKLLPEKPS